MNKNQKNYNHLQNICEILRLKKNSMFVSCAKLNNLFLIKPGYTDI